MANHLTKIENDYLVYSNPDLLPNICRHITSGGSLIEFAENMRVTYCDLIRWVRADAVRSKDYNEAIADRNEWAKERILQELRRISYEPSDVHPETGNVVPAQVRDRLKAIELYGKNLSMFTEKHELTGALTLDQLILATQVRDVKT